MFSFPAALLHWRKRESTMYRFLKISSVSVENWDCSYGGQSYESLATDDAILAILSLFSSFAHCAAQYFCIFSSPHV